jgi:hypothetical protein
MKCMLCFSWNAWCVWVEMDGVFLHGYVEVITSNVLRSPPWLRWLLWNICVTDDHGYVPLVEQELLTLLEHLR